MKKVFLLGAYFITFNLLSMNSAYGSPVKFESVEFRGNGCSNQNTSSVLSPSKEAVSILFDELSAEVPFEGVDYSGPYQLYKARSRKVCNMLFKVKLDKGQIIKNLKFNTDFRGMSFGEMGTRAALKSHLISWKESGRQKNMAQEIIDLEFGGYNFDEEIEESRQVTIPLNSNCSSSAGQTIEFVVKHYLEAEIDRFSYFEAPSSFIAIDSNDSHGNYEVSFTTVSCGHDSSSRPTRPNRPGRYDRDAKVRCLQQGGRWDNRFNRCVDRAPRRRR